MCFIFRLSNFKTSETLKRIVFKTFIYLQPTESEWQVMQVGAGMPTKLVSSGSHADKYDDSWPDLSAKYTHANTVNSYSYFCAWSATLTTGDLEVKCSHRKQTSRFKPQLRWVRWRRNNTIEYDKNLKKKKSCRTVSNYTGLLLLTAICHWIIHATA